MSRIVVEIGRAPERLAEIEQVVREAGLDVAEIRSEERGELIRVSLVLHGPARRLDAARLRLLRVGGDVSIVMDE